MIVCASTRHVRNPRAPHLLICRQLSAEAAPSAQAFFKILMGYRPPLPADMPPGYRSVMTSCWSADPDDRPDFEVIISSLQVRPSHPACWHLCHPAALCCSVQCHSALTSCSKSHAGQGMHGISQHLCARHDGCLTCHVPCRVCCRSTCMSCMACSTRPPLTCPSQTSARLEPPSRPLRALLSWLAYRQPPDRCHDQAILTLPGPSLLCCSASFQCAHHNSV